MKNKTFLIILGTFVVVLLAGIYLMNDLEVAFHGTTMILGVDLYPRWIGSKAALLGQSPYSIETRRQIWNAIYGNPNVPDGNLFGFYYPPSIVTLLAPFILIGLSLRTAVILWCSVLWSLWLTFLLIFLISIKKQPVLILSLLLISGIFFRPAFSNYLLGQYALFCVLMFISAWMALKNEHNMAGGIFAALALIKFSILILPVILLIIFYIRRLKVILSFLFTMLLFFLPPTVLIGWWVPDFLRDISHYTLENATSWSLTDIVIPTGILWLLLSGTLTVLGIYHKDHELALTSIMAFNGLFSPHTADYDLVIFVGLIAWLGYHWFTRRQGYLLSILFFLLLWFPFVSLLAFLYIHLSVMNWYRFIWLTYPLFVLLSAATEFFRQRPIWQQQL